MTSTNIYCDTLSSHRLKNQRPTIGNTIITKAKKRIIAAPSLYQNQSSTSPTAISTITVNTNNANVSVQYIEGEALLLRLDLAGVAASSGSACTSGSLDPSHVLLAIGLPHEIAHGSLRLTLSDETTEEEVDEVLRVLPNIVNTLRNMSPLYEMILQEGK